MCRLSESRVRAWVRETARACAVRACAVRGVVALVPVGVVLTFESLVEWTGATGLPIGDVFVVDGSLFFAMTKQKTQLKPKQIPGKVPVTRFVITWRVLAHRPRSTMPDRTVAINGGLGRPGRQPPPTGSTRSRLTRGSRTQGAQTSCCTSTASTVLQ